MNRNDNPASELRTRHRCRAFRALVISCLPCLFATAPAFAAQWNYVGPDAGLWLVPNNWQLSVFPFIPGFPNNGDNAVLGDNTISSVQSVTLNYSYSSPGLNSLTIDARVALTFTLNQGPGTDMYATNEYLGTTNYGSIYNQTGGTNTASSLSIGSGTGTDAQGNYLLSGTALLTVNTEVVGVNTATSLGGNQFNQSGGTHNVTLLTVGGGTNGTGTYNFSGGASTVFTLIVGDQVNDVGTYNMNAAAASLSVNGVEYIGNAATGGHSGGGSIDPYGGGFNQSTGTHSIAGGLVLAYNSGSTGSFTLSGGSLAVGTSNQFQLNAEYVGYSGISAFTQTGGTHTVGTPAANQPLYIGLNITGVGIYTLNNNAAPATLTVNGNEYVGYAAVGATINGTVTQYGGNFTQSAGNHTVTGSLFFGTNSASTGSFTLSGGTLATGTTNQGLNSEYVGDSGTGSFTQTGGTHTIGTPTIIQDLNIGLNTPGIGTYTLNNNAAAATLTVYGSEVVGYDATGTSSGGNITKYGGTFNQSAGSHTVARELILGSDHGSTGSFILSGGTLAVGTAAGGSGLPEYIGESGTGSFIQSGGTHTIGTPAANQSLLIGTNGNTLGTYTMNNPAATLTVNGGETVGGAGTGFFNQTAGTHTVTGRLVLASVSVSTGTFSLAGGTLTVGTAGGAGNSLEYIGFSGNANFTQSGGTHTLGTSAVNQSLFLGYTTTGAGAYTISNDAAALTVNGDAYFGGTSAAAAGVGVLNLSAGNATVTGNLKVWPTAGTALNLSGGVLTVGSLDLSANPSALNWTRGTLTLTGGGAGTTSFATGLSVGSALGNNCTLNLQGGNLTVGSTGGPGASPEYIGQSGTGAFTQSGGTHTVGTPAVIQLLSLGYLPGANGTYTMNNAAATLTVNGDEAVGYSATATGTFIQSAGSHTVTGHEQVGYLQGSTGSFAMTGGSLVVGTAASGALSSGEFIGYSGTGTFTQSGGSNTIGTPTAQQSLDLGETGTAIGTYALTGAAATLTVNGDENIGGIGTGIFAQAGGSHTIGTPAVNHSLFVGATSSSGNGTYTMSNLAATLTVNGNACFGGNDLAPGGVGVLNLMGGTATITGSLTVWNTPGSIVNLSGGSLHLGSANNMQSFTQSPGNSLFVTSTFTNSATASFAGAQFWSPTSSFTNTAGTASFQSNAKLYGLTITAGTVDITNSKLVIEPAIKSATLAALQSNLATHSLIATGIPSNFGLALLDNAITKFSTFGGQPADANSLLLSEELLGDTNIDGIVNTLDLQTILNNFGAATPNWTSGNFDHAPTIDLTDLSYVLNNFGLSNPNPSESGSAQLLALPAPEPASIALLLSCSPLLLRRRARA